MKASVFIKVALIDQMQLIADLGLWYHMATLISKGVNTLSRIAVPELEPDALSLVQTSFERSEWVKRAFPQYEKLPQVGAAWQSGDKPEFWYLSDPQDADKNTTTASDGGYFIHIPTWFEQYKQVCQTVLDKITSGEIEDADWIKNA